MKLDEAIKHAKEVAEKNECKECAEQHRQLAEWLKELKQLREQTQEPCEDCVSRKRLMDNYNGVETPVGYRKVVDMEVIKNLPSVIPITSWIPVSERLPEDYQRVLVTVVNYWGVEVVRVAEYHNQKRLFQIQEKNDKWKVGEKGFLAWLPLPKPYKAELEGEE